MNPHRAADHVAIVLAYATRGWPVFPAHGIRDGKCTCGKCEHPGKHPRTPHGLNDATTDVAAIRAWGTRWPDCNWGLRTGSASGVVVLDIDPRNEGDETLRELESQYGPLPHTVMALTGGGGEHYLFRHPGGVVPCKTDLFRGIDLKGDHGYIVVDPSIHASGKRYVWESAHHPENTELADLPAWLMTAIRAPKPRVDPKPGTNDKIPAIGRNNHLTSLAGTMRRKGMSKEAITAALLEENRIRFEEALAEDEVRKLAASVARYAPEARQGGAVIVRLSDVKPEPLQWLWPGRIPLGKVSGIAGDPETGKSLLTAYMAAAVSTGKPWPNLLDANPPGGVVILTAEDDLADTLVPRLDAAGADRLRIVQLRAVREETGERAFDLGRDMPALEETILSMDGTRLVIIDPITAYCGNADSHVNAAVRGLLAPLADLASRHRVAVVFVSHLNKGGGSKGKYRITGSLAFVAAARAAWLVSTDPESDDRRLLLPIKMNLARKPTGLAFRVVPSVGNVEIPAIEWDRAPVLTTADEALAAELEALDGREERNEAGGWLSEVLADGPRPAKRLFEEGKAVGFSESALRRAGTRLGVEHSRLGGAQGVWSWSLPSEKKDTATFNKTLPQGPTVKDFKGDGGATFEILSPQAQGTQSVKGDGGDDPEERAGIQGEPPVDPEFPGWGGRSPPPDPG